MSNYKESQNQEEKVKKLKIHSDYFKHLAQEINYKINEISYENKYIDKILNINGNIFVFRLTTSSHLVEINNNKKNWKTRSDICGATKTNRNKTNPHTYVPEIFEKMKLNKNKKVFFIYPVLKPYNKAVYDKEKYFIGSFEDSIKYINKRSNEN